MTWPIFNHLEVQLTQTKCLVFEIDVKDYLPWEQGFIDLVTWTSLKVFLFGERGS